MKAEQKKLKEVLKKELENYWKNQKMSNYCFKKTSFVVKFKDGGLLAIEKPSIQKDFCFGYHDSKHNTDSFDNANRMAHKAEKNVNYFMEQNLKDIERKIEVIDKELSRKHNRDTNIIVFGQYSGQSKDSKLRCWAVERYGEEQDYDDKRKLDPEEIKMLKDGYLETKKAFTKRLQIYLKRYGLSKVKAWSYWRDA